jgi:hypothetical protein
MTEEKLSKGMDEKLYKKKEKKKIGLHKGSFFLYLKRSEDDAN